MSKRLIDQKGLDGGDRMLADLFRSVAPFEADPFIKRRIWVRLERASSVRGAGAARFWLRPIVIAALLVSGTATAALGHRYILRGSDFWGLGGSPSATSPNVPVAPNAASIPKHVPGGNLAEHELAPPVASAASVASATPSPGASAPPRSTPKNGPARPESSEDATHMVQAIQALRTERDPARAQALLNDYLKANPHGSLSGDALALSIEAASAQHDPRAAEYARRYLAAYPKGKYRDLAKRALEAQR